MAERKKRVARDKHGNILTPEQQRELEIRRTRIPKDDEVLGFVDQRLGAGRLRIRCLDGKERICRVPGRLRRQLWIREGDLVLVKPWEYQKDDRGDILYKYTRSQVEWLRKKGYLDEAFDMDEF